MNTVIYARYSKGPNQTDQSIEGQVRVCKEFCESHGLTVTGEYCDRHITGRTDDRPEFQRLMKDAKKKKFEAVVVYKTDRLSRNKYDSAIYKRELKRNGIQIFYAAEHIPEGPEGIILESLLEGLAEYYSVELSQKVVRGMRESAYKCKSTGSGRPLGYTIDSEKHFQIDPESAQIVKRIYESFLSGQPKKAICEDLNAKGLRTVKGKPFNINAIDRILTNRKYIGEYKYKDIIIPGGIPAIIDTKTFNMAQREIEKRKSKRAPKSDKGEYLLSGRLFCGHCKRAMQGVSGTGKSGRKWYYYYCGNTRKNLCDKKQVRRDVIEKKVVQLTIENILKRDMLEKIVEGVYQIQRKYSTTDAEIAFYEKRLSETKESAANILQAIESGVVTKSLPERLQELEKEQVAIEGEIEFLKNKTLDFDKEQILYMLTTYLDPFEGESEREYYKRIITAFVSQVFVYDDKLIIFFNISGDDGNLKHTDLSEIEGEEFDIDDVRSAKTKRSNGPFLFCKEKGFEAERKKIVPVGQF